MGTVNHYRIMYENHITWARYESDLKCKLEDQIKFELDGIMYRISLEEGSYFLRYLNPNNFLYRILQRRCDLLRRQLHELKVQWRDSLTTKQHLALRKTFEEYYAAQDKIKAEREAEQAKFAESVHILSPTSSSVP